MTPKSGRIIAWLSFLLGIGVSIAGNIGHAASDGMLPGEWAGATFWPLALMLSIEILTRVRWQRGKRWTAARIVALVVVAFVAAVLSYRHLAGLMTYWGEDWTNSHLGPLAVDGLMLIAATALLSISKERDVAEPLSLPWDDPKADPVADIQAAKERYAAAWGVQVDEVVARPARDVAMDRLTKNLGLDDLPTETLAAAQSQVSSWQQWAPEPEAAPDSAPAPEPERKLHVVAPTTEDSAEIQSWIKEGLSLAEIANRMNVSKSTAHRRVKAHERRIQGR